LKHAPYRAATTNRRREIAEAEAATGQKVLQSLYSFDQTDWIIPDPIKDGVIPKNEYGNIDMFAEHMCPEGKLSCRSSTISYLTEI
jgi:xeroderma pigmentosum group C-complementing protein